MTSIPTSTPWVSPPSGRQTRRWNTLAPILLLLALAFLLAPPGASPPAQAAPQGAASLEDWNHSYPRIAMQHFGDANADWYARFDLIISQTSPRLIAATKALNPRTMFIFTDSVFVVDNYNNMPSCPGWSDQFLAVDSSGQVIEQQKGWPITDVSNLAPTNADGERFNQVIPRCFAEMAASGGYDGAGTDWFWDKPRKQDIDLDRNGVNDYQEHGEDWVNRTWREGAAVFMENWRKEINLRMGETTPIWINTGLLHDDAQMPGSLENTNGLEMERVPGFYSFSYAWRQYDRWIREGRKPTVWVTDARPSGSDPYTYRRRGHSKNYLELMRTMLAFTLMGDGYFEFQPIEAGEHKFYAYYDEFDVQLGDPIDRGAPGPADDAHLLANNLMVRFFENGAVILNPNPQPVTVRLEDIQGLEGYSGPYYRFRGGQDLALNGNQALNNGLPFDADHPITLDGHSFDQVEVGDGILLVKEPQTVVSDIIVDHLEAFTSPASAKAELQPTEVWENSPSQGNGWAQRQAAWNKAEPLYAYLQTTAAGAQATFRPNVGIPGAYEIFEWHPDVDGACAAVTAQIIIDGQVVQEMQIDQSRPGGRWYSLGQFDLPAGESSAVKLTTPGGCTATADAILFSYRGNSQGAFVDVPPSYWAYNEIQTLYEQGYIAGCSLSPRKYCPEDPMTRAESAVFVVRGVHGAQFTPTPDPALPFQDVEKNLWYYKWVSQLWADGYTAGCSADPPLYCPQRQHTVAEGSVFFLRMMRGPDYQPPPAQGIFADVPIIVWYAPWVEEAYRAGLLIPCSETPALKACPLDPLSRAYGAYMMYQAKGLGGQ